MHTLTLGVAVDVEKGGLLLFGALVPVLLLLLVGLNVDCGRSGCFVVH